MEKVNIKITQIDKQEAKGLKCSYLKLNFSGKSVNYALINTFRRLSLLYIPTYAFTKELIFIEENTSIFDNDYMRLRLSQLTLPNIKNHIITLSENIWKDVEYGDPNREKHPDDKKKLELFLNIENDTTEIKNVTSNDLRYFDDNEEKKNPFDEKYPLLLIQLRPGEKISCRLLAALGLGKRNDIWAAAANAFYEEIDENNYDLTIESQGQMNEYEILMKSCQIYIKKLEDIKQFVGNKFNNSSIKEKNELIIKLENEDHTLGIALNYFLQQNKNIMFSGLSKPDLLIDEIKIKLVSAKKNPLEPFFETIDFLLQLFNDIQNQLVKLSR